MRAEAVVTLAAERALMFPLPSQGTIFRPGTSYLLWPRTTPRGYVARRSMPQREHTRQFLSSVTTRWLDRHPNYILTAYMASGA